MTVVQALLSCRQPMGSLIAVVRPLSASLELSASRSVCPSKDLLNRRDVYEQRLLLSSACRLFIRYTQAMSHDLETVDSTGPSG